jgi:hypothetical protein
MDPPSHQRKNCKCKDNFQGSEREIGCRPLIHAWHRDRLANWLSVVR